MQQFTHREVHFSFGANVIASGAKQSPLVHLGIASSQKALLAMTDGAGPRSCPQIEIHLLAIGQLPGKINWSIIELCANASGTK
jgi:hypothetical protein